MEHHSDSDSSMENQKTPESMESHGVLEPVVWKLNDEFRRLSTWRGLVPIPLEPEDQNPDDLRRGHDYLDLDELLRRCQITQVDGARKFWPDQLLRRIMTKDRVVVEFQSLVPGGDTGHYLWGKDIQWYLGELFPDEQMDTHTVNGADNAIETGWQLKKHTNKQYLKIYTILVLCDQQSEIRSFIEAGIHDGDLPFQQCDRGERKKITLAFRNRPHEEISCFKSWKASALGSFHDYQYQVLIPYFCFAPDKSTPPVKHVVYYDRAIMPWTQEDKGKLEVGGYGIVSCMRIHPACHGYHDLEQVKVGNGMFALKLIKSDDIKDFQNETDMLGLFSGHHAHLVSLLVSFSLNRSNYLLFPWADCDLENYWKLKKPPYIEEDGTMDLRRMTWVSKQCCGLTSGLDRIHNPSHLHRDSDMRYGRHGDIKPENILWFQPDEEFSEDDGILVIGDLGIAAIHREVSRSNQPGKKIPYSPNYRPPECDMEGGIISRAYDIWTLGCLFLEMVCWVLGGTKLVEEFSAERKSVLFLGSRTSTNIFFDVRRTEDDDIVVLVKETVISRMSKLHNHKGCTEYLHDLLDIIYNDMIVVLADKVERIRSGPLLAKLEDLHRRVSEPEYGLNPSPRVRNYDPPVGIRARLNDNAMERISIGGKQNVLNTFRGKTARSKTVKEMKEVF